MQQLPQTSHTDSPWPFRLKVAALLWEIVWPLFCRWTPKPFNAWRLFWLRRFGAHLEGVPFVHQRARITHPWNLTLAHRACLGDGAHAYALGPITLEAHACVAQEVYLCAGTHDFTDDALPLVTAPIHVGEHAFVGARAFVLPGVTIGERTVIGAASVVSRDMPPDMICVGNPCKPLRPRNPTS